MLKVYMEGLLPAFENYTFTEIKAEEVQSPENEAIRWQVSEAMLHWKKSGAAGIVFKINTHSKDKCYNNTLAMSVVSEIRRRELLGFAANAAVVGPEEVCGSFEDMAKRNAVACLGDSITYGFPHGPRYSWVHMAGEKLDLNMVNLGQNGDTTSGMLYRFTSQVIPLNPSHVIIMGGINDVLMEVDTQSIKDNIAEIAFKSLSKGICPIIGVTTPIIGGMIGWYGRQAVLVLEDLQKWLRTFASEREIPVIDFCSTLTSPDGEPVEKLFVDGGHPSREGYLRMAGAAIDTLKLMAK